MFIDIGQDLGSPEEPFKELDRYKKTEALKSWNSATAAAGGTVEGGKWKPHKPQYTRLDGTVVPAWGGVPRVDGRGLVKGKRRNPASTARIRPDSVSGKDTGGLAQRLNSQSADIVGNTLWIGRNLPKYAGAIFGKYKRNPLRWKRADRKTVREIFLRWQRRVILRRIGGR